MSEGIMIAQMNDLVSVYDGKCTATYTISEFEDLAFAFRCASEVLKPPVYDNRYHHLIHTAEFGKIEAVTKSKSMILDEALKDLFEGAQNETL